MFIYKIQQFLYGRHGNDNLNNFILAMMIGCAALNIFFRSRVLYVLQMLLLVLWCIRFLSKNMDARNNENEKYLKLKNRFVSKHNNGYNSGYQNDYVNVKSNKKDKEYKYFKCPSCSTKLRVPKHKGKITITCPKCRTSFKGKS